MTKRQIIIVAILTGIIALIVSILFSRGSNAAPKKEVAKTPTKFLKTQTIQKSTLPLSIEAFGRVLASRNVTLSTEVQGTILEGSVALKSGTQFREGTVLFKIDDQQALYTLRALKSKFLNLMASALPDLKIDYKDNFLAWKQFFDAIDAEQPIPDLPAFKSSKEKTFLATKNILSDYYTIKSEEERIRKHTIRAPFDGTIIEAFTEVGATVSPGVNVASIIKNKALEVRVPIDVQNVQLVKIGGSVELTSQDGKLSWNGKVARIGQSVNSNTQSIDLFVEVENDPKAPLFNGMYINAKIRAGEVSGAVELSRRALQDNNTVFLIQDSALVPTTVNIVKANPETFITTALEDSQVVVTEPLAASNTNLKVAPLSN